MDLGLSPEQEELQRAARAALATMCPPTVARRLREAGADRDSLELLQAAGKLGWTGLSLPAAVGGAGNLVDAAVVAEEAGRALFPLLLESQRAAAALMWAAGGRGPAGSELVAVVDGSTPAVPCWATWGAPVADVRGTGADAVVDGSAGIVPDAMVADVLVVVTRTESGQPGVAVVPAAAAGVERERVATLDGSRAARVTFDAAPAVVLGDGSPDHVWSIRQAWLASTALHCVASAGSAAAALAMTTAYVTERQQFGRPIGSFQAVQHHVADMATMVDAIRLSAQRAVWRCAELDAGQEGTPGSGGSAGGGGDPGSAGSAGSAGSGGDPGSGGSEALAAAEHDVAVAKVAASRSGRQVSLLAHQLHGGIGFATSHDLYLWSDRLAAGALEHGTADEHLAILGGQLARRR